MVNSRRLTERRVQQGGTEDPFPLQTDPPPGALSTRTRQYRASRLPTRSQKRVCL